MPHLPSSVAAIADLPTLGPELVSRVEGAFRGGLRWFVLRAKAASHEDRLRLGREIGRACPGAFLSIHGDPEACRLLGAPGIHLPSRGFDARRVRGNLCDRLLGLSCHDLAEVREAEGAGADYAFLSPLFPPVSKLGEGEALGLQRFRAIAERVSIPLLALGGITPDRIEEAARAGAVGVAVLGDLFLAPDVKARASQIREAAQKAFGAPTHTQVHSKTQTGLADRSTAEQDADSKRTAAKA
jgi:thiamine-phosphate pyrophosphorylase